MYEADVAIIGAGPAGLFAVFECGTKKLSCVVIDSLDFVGGQCSALYPEKPIYDIPAQVSITGGQLTQNLLEQANRFNPQFLLGQMVINYVKTEEGFILTTSQNKVVKAKTVILAVGGGSFGPNKPPLNNIEKYEGRGVYYMVGSKSQFAEQNVAIAGGGDSAVDWAIILSEVAKKVYFIHRRDKLRAMPENVEQLHKIAERLGLDKFEFVIPYQLHGLHGDDSGLKYLDVADNAGIVRALEVDSLLAFFGLAMDIGEIKNWGFVMEHGHIVVDPFTMKTNIEGIYAIGDIATYQAKQKLILTAFNEGALAAQSIRKYVYPNEVMHFEYSTTAFK